MHEVFAEVLTQEMKYDANEVKMLSEIISSEVLKRVKKLEIPRHKIIVQTVIGEKKDQGFRLASRGLWDAKNDNYTSASWKNVIIYFFFDKHKTKN